MSVRKSIIPSTEDEDSISVELLRRMKQFSGFSPCQSFFDGSPHSSVDDSLIHMAQNHGFFVQYPEQLRDVAALLIYLGQKIGVAYNCVSCDMSFESAETAQKHMLEREYCHTNGDQETDLFLAEYGEFYDLDKGEEEPTMDGNENSEGCKDDEESDAKSGKIRTAISAKLQMPRTPSIRKYIRKGRGPTSDRKNSAVMQKTSVALRSPVARQAALMMVGGPAVAVVKGAPIAIAVAEKAMEVAAERKQSKMMESVPMRISERVLEEYRKLGWKGGKRLRERVADVERVTDDDFMMIVDGNTRFSRMIRFKHSMHMYNIGRKKRDGQ